MNLRRVELRDWKAYRHARFDFPAAEGSRNIILIGAPNGFGKTSFFEALTLGLFGREGLPLLPRATFEPSGGNGGDGKLQTSYNQFLKEAIHRRAIADGRLSCSVELEFEDDEGEAVTLKRSWHYSSSGGHKPGDEELLVYRGRANRALGPPPTVTDRTGWYRDFIARTFLGSPLAAFFLFDGERVRQFATRGMEDQVRKGIEGLLGLPVLRSLQDSLRRYADSRRGQVATPSDSKVGEVQAEINRLEAEHARLVQSIEEAEAILPRLETEREELGRDLSRLGGGSQAMLQDLIRDEQRLRSTAEKQADELQRLLGAELALALASEALRGEALGTLRAEEVRERWESGRTEGSRGLARFLEQLSRSLSVVAPPLDEAQRAAVLAQAEAAWEALWFPPPAGCAQHYLHGYLQGTAREQAAAKLRAVASISVSSLRELLSGLQENQDKAEAKKREYLGLEANLPAAREKQDQLAKLSEDIGALRAKLKADRDARDAAEGDLQARRAELGRYTEAQGRGAVPLRRAKQAESIAAVIGELLKEALPTQVEEVAAKMTEAWNAMARKKGLVQRVIITPDCEVRLLNSRSEDIREMQLSAGEEQIFTQALIWAIADISGRAFPFVVDTPLGRLDEEHRKGVLQQFTKREGQVIMLSTDTEVVGPYLDAIRRRVLCAYRLEARAEDGITITSPKPGYFEAV
jgi:DNA sulfur modification protein DndD